MEKGGPSFTTGGNVSWYSHYGGQYGGPLRNLNRTTMRSTNPIPGHTSRENHNPKGCMHLTLHCELFTIGRTYKQPKCLSIEGQIKKMWNIYTMYHIKRDEIMPFQ